MADIVDIAQDRMPSEAERIAASRRPEGPAANGLCFNCDDDVAPGVKFCCRECRDDYHKREHAQAQRV